MSKNRGSPPRLKRFERRKEMLTYHAQGLSPSTWIGAIAQKYGMSTDAVWKDWVRRDKWIPLIMHMEKNEEFVYEILFQMRAIRRSAWQVYRNAIENKNCNAAVAAIGQIIKVFVNEVKVLQSLGVLKKIPSKK